MRTKVKRITIATIKAFVKKNKSNLLINIRSSFNGMTDCCEPVSIKNGFVKAQETDKHISNTLGIQGAWFVCGGDDNFSIYNENGVLGFKVNNCCGSFIIAVAS